MLFSSGCCRAEGIASSAEDVTIPPPPRPALTRYHFDYCGPAMLTIFIVLTGEWVDAMDPGVGAVGPVASLFYLGVVVVGRYLIINLLIAIVLNAFADDTDELGLAWTGSSRPKTHQRYPSFGGMKFVPWIVISSPPSCDV